MAKQGQQFLMGLQLGFPIMGRNKKTRQSSGPRRALHAGHQRAVCCVLIASSALSACGSEQITKHGHQFRETDLAQVTPGMGQEQVKLVLGSPTTTSTYATGSAYYYISSTETQASFMKPTEVDRQVMAIYFTPTAYGRARRQLRHEGRQGVRLRVAHDAGARRQG